MEPHVCLEVLIRRTRTSPHVARETRHHILVTRLLLVYLSYVSGVVHRRSPLLDLNWKCRCLRVLRQSIHLVCGCDRLVAHLVDTVEETLTIPVSTIQRIHELIEALCLCFRLLGLPEGILCRHLQLIGALTLALCLGKRVGSLPGLAVRRVDRPALGIEALCEALALCPRNFCSTGPLVLKCSLGVFSALVAGLCMPCCRSSGRCQGVRVPFGPVRHQSGSFGILFHMVRVG
mmetsp:Transcript_9676/g.21596  ORF Transcript_9676/g.21596 Transcript_9676/m.21596 type:complete len:233 (+) Transcript_9676:167-865(+)